MTTTGSGIDDLATRHAFARRERDENFPVALRVLPARARRDLHALYAYARLVDDTGDEAVGDRVALLDDIEADVRALYGGRTPANLVVADLRPALALHDLPMQLFLDLIEANRRDQVVTRYDTIDDLLGYCALSANPVGRFVLGIFDAATPRRVALADKVCSGLQLVEHWQDVAEDHAAGRVYLPQADLRRFDVGESVIAQRAPTPAFRRLMAFEVQRTRVMLDAGGRLARTLRGAQRYAVIAFVAGGKAALDALHAGGYDVLTCAPRPTRTVRLQALAAELKRSGGVLDDA